MTIPSFPLDDLRRKNAGLDRVLTALDQGGGEVRLVGGIVRDHLRGLDISDFEIDLATTHLPSETQSLLEAAGIKTVPVGIEFGTVIGVAEGQGFEVTTLRADVETDGRHAKVEFTNDWTIDASRRDLTINALSVDMTGAVHDYQNGYDDLRAGLLRLIGVPIDRLHEDYLRLLRVFRFASQLGDGFSIDDATLLACTQAQSGLPQLSGERVWAELQKLLIGSNAVSVVVLMNNRTLFQTLFNQAADCDAFEKLRAAENMSGQSANPVRSMTALFGAANAAQILSSLNASGQERARAHAIDILLRPGALSDVKSLLRRIWKDGVDPAIDAAHLSGHLDALDLIASLANKSFPVQGRDVIAHGVAPGPDVGRILAALEDWWFDNDMPKREACLQQLGKLVD